MPEAELNLPRFDVTDKDLVTAVVRDIKPDACVHLAAISAVPAAQQDPDLAWRVNLGGTLNLAYALLEQATGCTLLFVSTADAYGSSFKLGVKLDEAAALNPMNIYGATKAAADLALGAMANADLRVIRARPFNHTGPGQSDAFVVAAFARQVARIEAGRQPPVLRVGALAPYRDFLDVRDVCSCYAQCLLQADTIPAGTILNIASGQPRRVGDVLDELLELAGVKADIALDAARLRPSEITLAAGDPARAQAMLGWAPAIAWRQTLADMLADWRTRIGAEPG
jgi:GDP-4-dehydro-6-deoxy-D-mannose reductase